MYAYVISQGCIREREPVHYREKKREKGHKKSERGREGEIERGGL